MSTARANTKIPRNFRNIDSSPHPLESAAQRNRVPVKRSAVLNFASDANASRVPRSRGQACGGGFSLLVTLGSPGNVRFPRLFGLIGGFHRFPAQAAKTPRGRAGVGFDGAIIY